MVYTDYPGEASLKQIYGICEAIRPLETLDVEGLVRLWVHEELCAGPATKNLGMVGRLLVLVLVCGGWRRFVWRQCCPFT